MRYALVVTLLFGLLACKEEYHPAQVTLEIEGKKHSYATQKAQYEERSDPGTYSIYAMPDKEWSQPYVCLRTYSGNPVRHLWVGYQRPEEETFGRFECFIPGTLSDGRSTLDPSWTRSGEDRRDRTETGEATCKATIVKEGSELKLKFNAVLQAARKRKKKKGATKTATIATTITASGTASLRL